MKYQYFCLLLATCLASPAVAQTTGDKEASVANIMNSIQQKTLTGTILDENHEPLPGASVRIKGTDNGVATDVDGNFSIIPGVKNPVIEITYIGMKPVEMALGDDFKYLRIVMQPAVNMMNDVVVTGYQNIKRESATGSYQILSADDLDKRSVTDLSSNLEGKIPGLVKNMKSSSNDEDAFTIRGTGSFQARTAPLVVVDGLPIEGGMSTVNPYDVENITVLKDAAAASIYGARASNGVIVITTKQAKQEKLTIDFNADLTISEKTNYDDYEWASAAEVLELEKYNFQYMLDDPKLSGISNLASSFASGRIHGISPATRMLYRNYTGEISDDELNSTFDKWSRNDYRREWQKVHDRTHVNQQYNIALRTQGKALTSSIIANYSTDNMGVKKENSNSLTFKYKGDLKVAKWFDLSLGVNVLNNRRKTHALSSTNYAGINSFLPYQSMYNEDGTLARMEAEIYPGYEAFDNPDFELKDCTYNLNEEMNRNFNKYNYTNVRTYIHGLFKLLPGWTAQAQFQYEDINSRSQTHREADTYLMRRLYSTYTTGGTMTKKVPIEFTMDVFYDYMENPDKYEFDSTGQMYHLETEVNPTVHHVPDGGLLSTINSHSQFYTFRGQTNYKRDFGPHSINVLAGMEYRQTHTYTDSEVLYGYDHATQSNLNLLTDWSFLNKPTTGVFGEEAVILHTDPITPSTSDVLHRFYSIYFNANYVYDNRYSLSGSYRVDKTDLFGADPKFRGRPLWSVGASWNMHNEAFMQPYTAVDALKLRASYGLTGNIDSSVSSYLTATIANNFITGDKSGTLVAPPNDQLRWEKTETWNVGVDFAFFGYRLNGSIDYYHKSGSDLLTRTDLDHTTGWTYLTINSGNMTNRGIEIQLDGRILQANSRNDLGINLGVNFAYNKNKITKVSHYPQSGYEYLTMDLREGYPMNSIFSFDYAGLIEKDGVTFVGWRDHEGEVHTTNINNSDFTIEDAIYCGTATPKFSGSLTPEITWRGFSLSAMFNFYGGHYMRINNDWYTGGTASGYGVTFGSSDIPASALNYWRGDTTVPANGAPSSDKYDYMSCYYGGTYRNNNVEHADYMKLRTLVLSYNFDRKLCRKIGLNDLRLRAQMNNVHTWVRNSHGYDPEAMIGSAPGARTPRSYTMSLFFNL